MQTLFEKLGNDGFDHYQRSLDLIDIGKNVGEVSKELGIPQHVIFARAYRAGKFNNVKFRLIKRLTRFNSIHVDCEW